MIKIDSCGNFQELLGRRRGKIFRAFQWFWRHTFARMGEDWVFLALLGEHQILFFLSILKFPWNRSQSGLNKINLFIAVNSVEEIF